MSAIPILPASDTPEPVNGSLWRLTVRQYHGMIDGGILAPDDPIELLEGLLVRKTSKNPSHRIATRCTRQALEKVIPAGWYVDAQEPITLADSEPEPDVAVIRGDTKDYVKGHPTPPDLMLVVEIAEATLDRDRVLKRRLYARAAIETYWLLDLKSRQLEVYSRPSADDYQQCRIFAEAESVPLLNGGDELTSVQSVTFFREDVSQRPLDPRRTTTSNGGRQTRCSRRCLQASENSRPCHIRILANCDSDSRLARSRR
ncbi:MAG: Uma2 family endonuclease [Acidobacteria bacterium]|nr:Uma2 family endonuclease [Acidobacteriota bacterium]